jgi:hypothetical protein
VALRKAAAALTRRSRGTGPAADDGASAVTPRSGEGDAHFLNQVQETLLQIATGSADASPEPGPPGVAGAGLRARLRRLAALLEPVRHHEDAVLALALLAGILVMILHWSR